ncbi:S-layer homology domain-containing protein, partial [Candidatus Gracilibacteria bacterium]|nr:S-layer homology domain-containing protein [Candidatus Gracilibacteria bacterium]
VNKAEMAQMLYNLLGTQIDDVEAFVQEHGVNKDVVDIFADVSTNDWYYNAILVMVQLGLIPMDSPLFNPAGNVCKADLDLMLEKLKPYAALLEEVDQCKVMTRAQVVMLLADFGKEKLGLECPADATQTFADLPPEHEAFEAVECFTAYGILEGDVNGGFNPDDGVNRAEFAKLLYATLELKTADLKEFAEQNGINKDADAPEDTSSPDWYYYYVLTLVKLGIFDENKAFNPSDGICEEDAAEALAKAV